MAQTRLVAEQMADADVVLQVFEHIDAAQAGRARVRTHHAHAAKFGNPALDRVAQPEVAFIQQFQYHHRGDQLGARIRAVDVIRAQRLASIQIGFANTNPVNDFAIFEHKGRDARQQAAIQTGLQDGV